MKILIICGPGAAPIDEVRRITNHSTGKLGIILSNVFHAQGAEVHCVIGQGRTCCIPLQTPHVDTFFTTQDLAAILQAKAKRMKFDAVLHAAALSDFELAGILDEKMQPLAAKKISSKASRLFLEMRPAPKLLPQLRSLFPKALIVGWKYELEGTLETGLAKAFRQIESCQTDGCVLNGSVVGQGFVFCHPDGQKIKLGEEESLAQYLLSLIR